MLDSIIADNGFQIRVSLTYKARQLDLETPILKAIMPSNQNQVEVGIRMITDLGKKNVGILGFSFKAGTDDLRESPLVDVIEHLLGKGYNIKIHDQNVNVASLVGANKDYILTQIPHISALMAETMGEVLDHADVIVIGNTSEEFTDITSRSDEHQTIVDLVRIASDGPSHGSYEGICW